MHTNNGQPKRSHRLTGAKHEYSSKWNAGQKHIHIHKKKHTHTHKYA